MNKIYTFFNPYRSTMKSDFLSACTYKDNAKSAQLFEFVNIYVKRRLNRIIQNFISFYSQTRISQTRMYRIFALVGQVWKYLKVPSESFYWNYSSSVGLRVTLIVFSGPKWSELCEFDCKLMYFSVRQKEERKTYTILQWHQIIKDKKPANSFWLQSFRERGL